MLSYKSRVIKYRNRLIDDLLIVTKNNVLIETAWNRRTKVMNSNIAIEHFGIEDTSEYMSELLHVSNKYGIPSLYSRELTYNQYMIYIQEMKNLIQ